MADAGARGFVAGRSTAFWLVLLAAGGTFAVTMGARQSMGLFLNTLNTSTGLGLASISLAFAFGQLWWGLTQPFAGMVADRYGAGRVIVAGVLLVALGTALVPFMTTTAGLILAIGVLAAGGAGMAGVSVLMAATTRLVSPERRGMATGLVNAGGSFGQFVFAPIAQGVTAVAGWVVAMQSLAVLSLLALPAAWVLRGHSTATAAPERRSWRQPAKRSDAHCRIRATGCSVPASSSAAFTSPSSPRTCRAWSPPVNCRPRLAPGLWRSSACSTSSAASLSAGRSVAGA
jgi:MFS family permease